LKTWRHGSIESGTPISAENIRALSARRIGALRNVSEKSAIAERLLSAPDFTEAIDDAFDYIGRIEIKQLGMDGDAELIFAIVDKLFTEYNGDFYVEFIVAAIVEGAIRGNHRGLVGKLVNDPRMTIHDPCGLMCEAIKYKQYDILRFFVRSPKISHFMAHRLLRTARDAAIFIDADAMRIITDASRVGGGRNRNSTTKKRRHVNKK
jgi:hypothetical protein